MQGFMNSVIGVLKYVMLIVFLEITIGFAYLGSIMVEHDDPKLMTYTGYGAILGLLLASVITGTVFTLVSIKEGLDKNNRLLFELIKAQKESNKPER